MHLYLIHFQQYGVVFFCVCVSGVERGRMTEGHWRTDGREYLRIKPKRLRFLVLFNSLIARNLGEVEHWFIELLCSPAPC